MAMGLTGGGITDASVFLAFSSSQEAKIEVDINPAVAAPEFFINFLRLMNNSF
jgi:hypothetical protein